MPLKGEFMTETEILKIKSDFKDRLFFYPLDALYILEISKALHLSAEEEYRLSSIMGAAELRNTLPLYNADDFLSFPQKINLLVELPKTPEKIKILLDTLAIQADKNQTHPSIFALLSESKDNFMDLFRILLPLLP